MDVGASIIGGLAGGGVMIVLLYMSMAMMPSQMKMNLLLLLGTMLVPVGAAAYVFGFAIHAMMSVGFGLVPCRDGRRSPRNDASAASTHGLIRDNRPAVGFSARLFRPELPAAHRGWLFHAARHLRDCRWRRLRSLSTDSC